MNNKNTCFLPAQILLPKNADMSAWACIACDQFTGDIDYWKTLEKFVSGKPTTLDLTLPEIYLKDNLDKRIERVNSNIKSYIDSGVFKTLPNGFVLTVRSTKFVKRRIGLIGKIDLESYEYSQKSSALIRSTEGTIEERIPPRLKIRKSALVEFPHIMVLFDDEKREINEQLYKEKNSFSKLYDFDLNMDGGHIEGYFIPEDNEIIKRFDNLLDIERLKTKYGKEDMFLFAVGDGNHSLATAKAHWNNIKATLSEKEKLTHPARYALVEMVNIYDEGIYFEPIHRFVTVKNKDEFINCLNKIDGNFCYYDGDKEIKKQGSLSLPLTISCVDKTIKEYISEFGGEVDYIHGDKEVKSLVDKTSNSVAVLFDKMNKQDLFKFVSENGSLPRKTFSMGEGIEKRYYLEGRKIVNE